MSDIKDIWNKTLDLIEQRISGPSFETWLKETEALSIIGDNLVIGVPTDFIKEWLENRYAQLICDVLYEVTGTRIQVTFIVGSLTTMAEPFSRVDEVISAQLN
ncbi:MAG: DnaA N-terminal domain-containing protein, partial [Eubacteriales bacterium]|nr:DnaA N-terminal domain-containing protein [Eubacteriales bacterium]